MIWTLFMFPGHTAYKDDADMSSGSKDAAAFPAAGTKHNVLWRRIEELTVAPSASFTLDIQDLTKDAANGDWCMLLARVIGNVTISTTGKDADGATGITAAIPFYGTPLYPDMGIITTYNVSSFVVNGLAVPVLSANPITTNTVELFAAILCPDGDTRLTTYAST